MSNEKLQALFEAALKAPEVPEGPAALRPAQAAPVAVKQAGGSPASGDAKAGPVKVIQPVEFDREEADELGKLLDEQVARIKRKRSLDFVITMCVIGGMLLGGVGWFVSDGKRVEAFRAAVADVRSVSDIQGIVARFQDSLNRISVRSGQIDEAAASLGVDVNDKNLKDVHMEAEMKEMMGDEGGRTTAERNRMLQKKFGEQKAGGGVVPK